MTRAIVRGPQGCIHQRQRDTHPDGHNRPLPCAAPRCPEGRPEEFLMTIRMSAPSLSYRGDLAPESTVATKVVWRRMRQRIDFADGRSPEVWFWVEETSGLPVPTKR